MAFVHTFEKTQLTLSETFILDDWLLNQLTLQVPIVTILVNCWDKCCILDLKVSDMPSSLGRLCQKG